MARRHCTTNGRVLGREAEHTHRRQRLVRGMLGFWHWILKRTNWAKVEKGVVKSRAERVSCEEKVALECVSQVEIRLSNEFVGGVQHLLRRRERLGSTGMEVVRKGLRK